MQRPARGTAPRHDGVAPSDTDRGAIGSSTAGTGSAWLSAPRSRSWPRRARPTGPGHVQLNARSVPATGRAALVDVKPANTVAPASTETQWHECESIDARATPAAVSGIRFQDEPASEVVDAQVPNDL